jgi:6-phospho-beta-glucosidase
MVEKAGVPMKVYKTLDRRAALEGAHFVTTQLRVGQLKAREKDERIPLSHGYLGRRPTVRAACLKVCVPFR